MLLAERLPLPGPFVRPFRPALNARKRGKQSGKCAKLSRGNVGAFEATGAAMMDRIPFLIGPLDVATFGGAPRGRNTLLTGNSGTGKTTVACRLLKSFQQEEEGQAIFILGADKKDE